MHNYFDGNTMNLCNNGNNIYVKLSEEHITLSDALKVTFIIYYNAAFEFRQLFCRVHTLVKNKYVCTYIRIWGAAWAVLDLGSEIIDTDVACLQRRTGIPNHLRYSR